MDETWEGVIALAKSDEERVSPVSTELVGMLKFEMVDRIWG